MRKSDAMKKLYHALDKDGCYAVVYLRDGEYVHERYPTMELYDQYHDELMEQEVTVMFHDGMEYVCGRSEK